MDADPSQETLIAAQPREPSPPKVSRLKRLARRFDRIFMLTVLLPTLVAAVYYGLIASDVYISESRFVVRSPQRQAPSGLGALLQGTGFSRSQDDTYSVHDYIRSRDALRELDEKLGLRVAFSSPDVDPVNRFPGIAGRDRSFEALYRHYLKHVEIDYDTVSSISVLRVRSYSDKDVYKINDLLLTMGERLVNNLNTRSRQDLIQVATQEVTLAEEKAKAAALALSGFRSERSIFDPDRQSSLQLQAVAKVQEELLTAEAQLAQMRQLSPNNPQMPVMTSRVESLRRTVATESAKITGGGSLTSKSPVFDRLVLEKTFADRQLGSALASLETARSDAARKQLYLERLVQPNLPDASVEPRRMRSIVMVFAIGLLLWGVISLIVSSIREHIE